MVRKACTHPTLCSTSSRMDSKSSATTSLGDMSVRAVREETRASEATAAAEAAQKALEGDWASKVGEVEAEKLKEIQALDRAVQAEKEASKSRLAEQQAAAQREMQKEQEAARAALAEREGQLRAMELQFSAQQHTTRHLERLAKMKVGTQIVKHNLGNTVFGSSDPTKRFLVLSDDHSVVAWAKSQQEARKIARRCSGVTGKSDSHALRVADIEHVHLGHKTPLFQERARLGMLSMAETSCISLVRQRPCSLLLAHLRTAAHS